MGASPVLFFRAPRARPEGGGLGPAAEVSGSAGRPVAAPSLIYMYDPDATLVRSSYDDMYTCTVGSRSRRHPNCGIRPIR